MTVPTVPHAGTFQHQIKNNQNSGTSSISRAFLGGVGYCPPPPKNA
ncbi:MAG: hypothetical protein VKL39_04450 [Leptolyngbyaceae bacterium]|nr:hypothetical protein [Leptolyngbyaceae bacterium]